MLLQIVIFYTTFSYIGFIPFAPGTFASLFSIPIFLIIHHNPFIYISTLTLIIILAIPTINLAESYYQKKDPSYIVIDEVIGLLLSMFSFHPQDGYSYFVIGFILFRFFDIFKPFPINSSQKIPRAYGVLADDCCAALFTNLSLQSIYFFFQSLP